MKGTQETQLQPPPSLLVQRHRSGALEGDLIWIQGQIQDNRPHRHHAMQLCWAPSGQARVVLEDGVLEGGVLLLAGGVSHALKLDEGGVCLIPGEGHLGAALEERWLKGGQAVVLPGRLTGIREATERLQATVSGRAPPLEPRIHRVLEWLDEMERAGRWAEVTLVSALAQVHLSEGRFRHLWTQAMGTPWRSYLTWRRALVAMTLAKRGLSLTETAYLAGYSDSAHLSRQVAQLFGFSPSLILKNSRFVQGGLAGED